jgi:hypothetical protein
MRRIFISEDGAGRRDLGGAVYDHDGFHRASDPSLARSEQVYM